VSIEILSAATEREIDAAFAKLVQNPGGALLTSPDSFLFNRRAQLVTLAARHAVPAIYPSREWADVGGLISYGPDLEHTCELAGVYTGRVLKGEKPADLPVLQPTKFEMVINLTTAKALGVAIPNTLTALADAVIE
jgi:putative tryptophan/tyrosine transport system substrate-binding protein